MRKGRGFALAALITTSWIATPLAAVEPEATSTNERIDALFEGYSRSDAPGVAVALILDGKIVYEKAFGMADLERGVALTPRSVFEIGSVSKQFTAMCILLLEDEGKLALDDDIRTVLPEMPDYGQSITIRQLLHHTSGIRDIETLLPLAGWPYTNYYTTDQQLELIARQSALNFPPGTEHLYSNSGYLLLAEIVERLSGKALRAFAEERIFEPLGMRDSVFYDSPTQVIVGRALPYSQGDDGDYRMELWYLPFVGPSGLYTNLEDLARWDANFYANQLGGGPALIERMLTPGTLTSGETTGYAAGLGVAEYKGHPVIGHFGAWMGYRAEMTRFPEDRLSVILLSNASSIGVGSVQIADLFLDGDVQAQPTADEAEPVESPATVTLPPDVLARYEGTYWNEDLSFLRTLEVRDAALYLVRAENGSASELGPLGDGRFVMLGMGVDIKVAFSGRSDAGTPAMTLTIADQQVVGFRRLESLPSTRLAEIAGRYWSADLDRALEMRVADDGLEIAWADNDRSVTALPLAADDFLARHFVEIPWNRQDARLRIQQDDVKGVTGLTLSCEMVRDISFSRIDGAAAERY
jgi:CubicO group peptidase (beta-lactamase class C family)